MKADFIPGLSPIKKCDIHRDVRLDALTGLRSCGSGATSNGPTIGKVYEFWPSDIQKIFSRAGIPRRSPPPYGPDCDLSERVIGGIAPKISSPRRGVVYNLRSFGDRKDKIPFAAVSDADSGDLYWFLNEKFIGRGVKGESVLWSPRQGDFIVRVIDEDGRHDSRPLKVVLVE